MTELSPGQVIAAMLLHSKLERFPRRMEWLQRTIRELRADPEFTDLLNPFVFSAPGVDIYPFSRLLDETLMAMMTLGRSFAADPFFEDWYLVNPDISLRNQQLTRYMQFDQHTQTKLVRLGQAFAEKVQREMAQLS